MLKGRSVPCSRRVYLNPYVVLTILGPILWIKVTKRPLVVGTVLVQEEVLGSLEDQAEACSKFPVGVVKVLGCSNFPAIVASSSVSDVIALCAI